ncbi:mannosyltransferase family protein [Vitiosangium sp. GDMCC 1.1324]|uniref:mannosyltransferase family protein n=1 Tax=Vitiosangium sp. (strain GDMCC 1.1324) TaxID=2138576 RepID=UPI000D3D18D3|nr:mannosyltransferase family protein [Vitiosangium sp. GDMCC 1.1324]PTL81825.1 hypothetical protein DAT35_23100 [Vitiosangium sp. GDMCC 1.1324]
MKPSPDVAIPLEQDSAALPLRELSLGAPVSRAFLLGSAAGVFIAHLALWLWVSWTRGPALTDILDRWDASHYTLIIREGYSGEHWAFFPLYPMTVRAVASVLGVEQVQVLGAVLSTAAFLGFALLVARARERDDLPEGLMPRTRLGWLVFLLAPASYVFHSHHTESLFLVLSSLALFFGATRRPGWGGLLAALCVLTRNQGAFVVLATAVLAATREQGGARRLRAFVLVGALGALGALCFLAFEYLAAGTPLAFLHAQNGWHHADSVAAVFKTFIFGNPWQNTRSPYLLRYGVFWVCLIGTWFLSRRQPALGLYAALSMAVMLLQGEVANVFRFGTVVFPLLFFLGDRCARRPVWFQGVVVVALLLLNLATARGYAVGRWAY